MMNVLGCLDIPTRGTYHLDGVDAVSYTHLLPAVRSCPPSWVQQRF